MITSAAETELTTSINVTRFTLNQIFTVIFKLLGHIIRGIIDGSGLGPILYVTMESDLRPMSTLT